MTFAQSPITAFMAQLDALSSEHDYTAVIAAGLGRETLTACATGLGVSEKELCTALARSVPSKKALTLDATVSDELVRVAYVLRVLATQKGFSSKQCWAWLTQACSSLKGRIPVHLLKSTVGTEYVVTAASRIE